MLVERRLNNEHHGDDGGLQQRNPQSLWDNEVLHTVGAREEAFACARAS